MTESRKPLSFTEIADLANDTTWPIKKLARIVETDNPFAKSGDPDEVAPELAVTVNAIRIVMDILGATPNACINREALDALHEQIEPAVAMLTEKWAVDLLNNTDKQLADDEIAF
jgi:hypothetical protein